MILSETTRTVSLIVEGNLGAGKSTFLSLIQKQLDVDIVYEPHTKWQSVEGNGNLLNQFYQDPARWAYTFQTYAFVTRVIEQQRIAASASTPFCIIERSVYADRYCFAKNCYQMGFMSELEWSLYTQWFEWLVHGYTSKPDGFIYLRVSPEVCYQRMLRRNRIEELQVTREYLERIDQKHEQWLVERHDIGDFLRDVPVLVLEAHEDFEHNPTAIDAHVEKISSFYKLPRRSSCARFRPSQSERGL